MRMLGATVDGEALGTVSEALVSVIEEVAAEVITDWVSDGIWDSFGIMQMNPQIVELVNCGEECDFLQVEME